MSNGTRPDPVPRPDGRLYRPRKIAAYAVTDPDDGDMLCGVVVLGTHDLALAQLTADGYVSWQLGAGYAAVSPVAVWWRDSCEGGRRGWTEDKDRGRAGIWFREIAERTP